MEPSLCCVVLFVNCYVLSKAELISFVVFFDSCRFDIRVFYGIFLMWIVNGLYFRFVYRIYH